jgi:hypothetical protein
VNSVSPRFPIQTTPYTFLPRPVYSTTCVRSAGQSNQDLLYRWQFILKGQPNQDSEVL